MISFIIATSNDHFCGDNMLRLNNNILTLVRHQLNSEIIIVDWGDTGVHTAQNSEPYTIIKQGGQVSIRYIRVPTSEPFHETLAQNIGIRRAKGDWIARLDQDILVGERFAEWWRHNNHSPYQFFTCLRRELSEDEHEIRRNAPIGNEELADTKWFFFGSPGIVLAPRKLWHDVYGYNEELRWRNHMEHHLIMRMMQKMLLVNIGPTLNYDFYHQGHKRIAGLKENEYRDPDSLALHIASNSYKNPKWGNPDITYPEVVI